MPMRVSLEALNWFANGLLAMRRMLASVAGYLLVSAILVPTTVLAFDTKSVEVSGLKLYEPEAKTLEDLKDLGGPSSSLDLAIVSQLIGGGSRTGVVSFTSGGYFFWVKFSELLPPRKGNVVSTISLVPIDKLSEAKFWESALAKYGPPDQSSDDAHVTWCQDGWTRRQNPNSASKVCNGWVSLELSRDKAFPLGQLMLSDTPLEMAAMNYLRKTN
jgi:hypothetical protein